MFYIWTSNFDVNGYSSFLGDGTPIRRGLGGISVLRWSPTGDYFFAAKLYDLNLIFYHLKFINYHKFVY